MAAKKQRSRSSKRTDADGSLDVRYVALSDLTPYERNPRTHNEEQVRKIADSIREFGFNNPILIDSERGIIAGHGRLMAAQLLGLDTVPVVELSHLTDEQKRAYVIADNQLALQAGWDYELLRLELEGLQSADFDVQLLGFTDVELKSILGGWHDGEQEVEDTDVDESGLTGRIVIRCPIALKEDVHDVISAALKAAAFEGIDVQI